MCPIVSLDSGSIPCRSCSGANESIGLRSEDHSPRLHVLLTECIHRKRQVAKAYVLQEMMFRFGMISRLNLVSDSTLE
jgi:hypothetical protein